MPQRLEKLRDTLQELEDELREIETLDGPTRALLEEAAREIEVALHHHDPEYIARHQSLGEDLQTAVVRFSSSHPHLATILGRLADAMAQLGI